MRLNNNATYNTISTTHYLQHKQYYILRCNIILLLIILNRITFAFIILYVTKYLFKILNNKNSIAINLIN